MASVLGLFAPEALAQMMVEGFALAFERRLQGTTTELLTDALQLAADLRVFKEGLFLTGKQVCRLLQISERNFSAYKKRHQIEVDLHIGAGEPRYSLPAVLAARQQMLLAAAHKSPHAKAKARTA